MAENVIKMNYTMDIHRDCIKNSLVAPHLTTKYKFEGAKGVIIEEPQTVEMQDYTRTGTHRYGTPTEVQYYAQEMIMGQDKSFSLTIDKGNQKDRSAKAYGAEVMRKQVVERAIPMQDAHSLYVLAHKAGTIVGNATALEKGNVVERIFDAGVALDDAEFPTEDRTLFVSSNVYKLIKLSEEFSKVDKLAEKSLTKGLVGYLDNMKVIKVPKKRWPANVNFILVHKSAGTAPTKIKDAKMYLDAPGISGYLLEGSNSLLTLRKGVVLQLLQQLLQNLHPQQAAQALNTHLTVLTQDTPRQRSKVQALQHLQQRAQLLKLMLTLQVHLTLQ